MFKFFVKKKTKNYVYDLIDFFALFVNLCVICRDRQQFDFQQFEYDFSKFEYEFRISIENNDSKQFSINNEQSIQKIFNSIERFFSFFLFKLHKKI